MLTVVHQSCALFFLSLEPSEKQKSKVFALSFDYHWREG